jgi:hypothetical protein
VDAGSQPLVRGKVLNHAVSTDAGQLEARPGDANTITDHRPRCLRKFPEIETLPSFDDHPKIDGLTYAGIRMTSLWRRK